MAKCADCGSKKSDRHYQGCSLTEQPGSTSIHGGQINAAPHSNVVRAKTIRGDVNVSRSGEQPPLLRRERQREIVRSGLVTKVLAGLGAVSALLSVLGLTVFDAQLFAGNDDGGSASTQLSWSGDGLMIGGLAVLLLALAIFLQLRALRSMPRPVRRDRILEVRDDGMLTLSSPRGRCHVGVCRGVLALKKIKIGERQVPRKASPSPSSDSDPGDRGAEEAFESQAVFDWRLVCSINEKHHFEFDHSQIT